MSTEVALAKEVRGIVRTPPAWASNFPINTEVAVGTSKPEDPTWGVVSGYADDYEYPVERSRPWPYDPDVAWEKRLGRFIALRLYDGVEVLAYIENVSLWRNHKYEWNIFGSLLCLLGLHAWEKGVPKRGLVRSQAWFGGWLTMQDQDGLQGCRRAKCTAERKVSRSGTCYNDTEAKWKPAR